MTIFWIRTSRFVTLCQDAKYGNISLSAKIGFLGSFFIDKKKSFGLFRGEKLIAKLVKVKYYMSWSFNFSLQIAVLKETMTKFTEIL